MEKLKCQSLQFKEFGPKQEDTGYDGSLHWKILHDEVKKIECEYCRDKAIKLMRGVHDSVNVHLGKEKMYPKDLEYLLKYVAWANKEKKGLRCFKCQS